MEEINLILLCGQGSIGKSTFGKKWLNYYPNNSILVRMDNIDTTLPWNNRYIQYISQVQLAIDSNKYFCILCDSAQDTVDSRKILLNSLKIPSQTKINLIIIQLRPGVDKIINWHAQRIGRKLSIKEQLQIIKLYSNYNFASEKEFDYFHYNTLKIYTYNNSLQDNFIIDIYSNITNSLVAKW